MMSCLKKRNFSFSIREVKLYESPSCEMLKEKREKNPPDGILLLLSLSFVVASITSEMRNKRNWIPFLFWHNSSSGKERDAKKGQWIHYPKCRNQSMNASERKMTAVTAALTVASQYLQMSLSLLLKPAAGEVELHTILLRSNNSLMHTLDACTRCSHLCCYIHGVWERKDRGKWGEGVSNFWVLSTTKRYTRCCCLLWLGSGEQHTVYTFVLSFASTLTTAVAVPCSLTPANESFRVETSVCLC